MTPVAFACFCFEMKFKEREITHLKNRPVLGAVFGSADGKVRSVPTHPVTPCAPRPRQRADKDVPLHPKSIIYIRVKVSFSGVFRRLGSHSPGS